MVAAISLDQIRDIIFNNSLSFSSIQEFIEWINWNDEIFIYIVVFHLSMTIFAMATRNHFVLHSFVFVAYLLMIPFLNRINAYLSDNWKHYASKNYFSDDGIFLSVFIGLPILITSFVMLFNILTQVISQLVATKRAEHRYNQKKKKSN